MIARGRPKVSRRLTLVLKTAVDSETALRKNIKVPNYACRTDLDIATIESHLGLGRLAPAGQILAPERQVLSERNAGPLG